MFKIIFICFNFICVFYSTLTLAGVTAEVSRIIFNEENREQSLRLINLNDYPVIVQLWVDDGDINGTPDKAVDAPVIPLPAILKMAPKEQRNVRLVKVINNVVQDREYLQWLNIYEIPPEPSSQGDSNSKVILTMHTQMKLILRPKKLDNFFDKMASEQRLRLVGEQLEIFNPTPFYVTYTHLSTAESGTNTVPLEMINPFGKLKIKIPSDYLNMNGKTVFYLYYLDDSGNFNKIKMLL